MTSDDRPPTRAWQTHEPRTHSSRPRRTLPPGLRVDLDHAGSPRTWEELPGVEFWDASLWAKYPFRDHPLPSVPIVTARLIRINLELCDDFVFYLSNISREMSDIGEAILSSSRVLGQWSILESEDTDIVIADDVVVDSFWRGRGIGPVLLAVAADSLRAAAVFLSPCALPTRVRDGVCYSDYELPRAGLVAQAKVERAWRRGGFRKLRDGVVWRRHCAADGVRARARLADLEQEAHSAQARVWYRRRAERRARATQH